MKPKEVKTYHIKFEFSIDGSVKLVSQKAELVDGTIIEKIEEKLLT